MQLSGELTKVSVPNLLQLVRTGALTGIISFNKDMKSGSVLVENGFPCHAEAEGLQGLEALLELFLWNSGTFAFNEEDLNFIAMCNDHELSKCTLEYILKEGLQYVENKNFLDELGVTLNSVLKPVEKTKSLHPPEISLLNGKKTLKEALSPLNLSKSMFVGTVANWLIDGLAELVLLGSSETADSKNNQSQSSPEPIRLPSWVVARLRQENRSISQAIINMVVWTDRAKIWLYQLEGDFGKLREVLETGQSSVSMSQSQDHVLNKTQDNLPDVGFGDMISFTDDVNDYPECGSSDPDADLNYDTTQAPMVQPQPMTQDSFSQGGLAYGFGAPMSSLGYFGQGRSQSSAFGGMRRHSYSSDMSMFSLDHRSYEKEVTSNQKGLELPNMEVVNNDDL